MGGAAGRGPAIGPLVLAAVALDSRQAAVLTRKGLCDSKTYGAGEEGHSVRSEIAVEIRKRATFVATIEVEHTEIDERVLRGELNVLEREVARPTLEEVFDRAMSAGKVALPEPAAAMVRKERQNRGAP